MFLLTEPTTSISSSEQVLTLTIFSKASNGIFHFPFLPLPLFFTNVFHFELSGLVFEGPLMAPASSPVLRITLFASSPCNFSRFFFLIIIVNFFYDVFLLDFHFCFFLKNVIRPGEESSDQVTDYTSASEEGNIFVYTCDNDFYKRIWCCHLSNYSLWAYFYVLCTDSYAAELVVSEGESVYDFCWYPYMSASGAFFLQFATKLFGLPFDLQ